MEHSQGIHVVDLSNSLYDVGKLVGTADYTLQQKEQFQKLPVGQKGCWLRRNGPSRSAVPAALASFLAIVVLISMCSFAQRRTAQLQTAGRKLADRKESSSDKPPSCLEGEEEADSLASSRSPARPDLPASLEPPKKRWKRMAMTEASGEESLAGPSEHPALGPQPDPAAFSAPLYPGYSMQLEPLDLSVRSGTHSEVPLDLSLQPSRYLEPMKKSLVSPETPDIPPPVSPEQSVAQETQAAALPTAEALGAASAEGAAADMDDPIEGPSGASAHSPTQATPPEQHPYFRLPVLQPEVSIRPIDLSAAESTVLAPTRSAEALARLRGLLVKKELCQPEANEVLDCLERMMGHCMYYRTSSLVNLHEYRLVEELGMRFLLLDGILSGLHVLKQEVPTSFWKKLVDSIPHHFEWDPVAKGRKSKHKQKHNRDTARKLRDAIEVLKTGKRLSAKETLEIKSLLFCNEHMPRRFQGEIYNPWRQDCPDT